MTLMLQLPAALEAAGINVRTLDGWDEPHVLGSKPYLYREADGEPAGVMHHHTASGRYLPNRDKATAFVGLSYLGSDWLYQERYLEFGYEPVITFANAYPAPISAGAGSFPVLEDVRDGIGVTGRPGDDTPGWYGNTHYVNYEWVLEGDGDHVDPDVWEMMLVVCAVQNDLYKSKLWTPNNHIAHGHHTGRKVDLWAGQFSDTNQDGFDKTIIALREQLGAIDMGLWANDWTDKSWMTFFDDTTIPGVEGDGRYYCSGDDTYTFSPAFGTIASDGKAAYAEKVHAINYVFSGFALALDQG